MAEEANSQHNYPAKEVSGIGSRLDFCIRMLSNVGNSLRPGGDINQYTLKALSASYKDLGTVYRTLEKVSDDEDTGEDDALEKILTDLGGALGHLETAVQLMKEHEGVVPMADDKKSKGGIFDEAGDYRNRCHRKLRQVIKSLKGWRKTII